MDAHAVLELFNELGKKPSMFSLFRNEFNKFNNTDARILDFIYHLSINLFRHHILMWNIKTLTHTRRFNGRYFLM